MAASPAKTVRARLDEQSTRALAILTAKGQTESQAVRGALIAAADATRRRAALAQEAATLAGDPVDTAERMNVMADMDDLAPDVPA